MIRRVFAAALVLLASIAAAQGDPRSREQTIYERHDPKDYHGELKAALARYVSRDGTVLAALSAETLGLEIKETSNTSHPVRQMWMQEMVHETITRPNGTVITSSRGRPRGIAVISSIEGRMKVETFLSESEIRARPRRVYEMLPSRLCPQVLAAFDIRSEPHIADKEEQKASARLDARFPELLQFTRANAQEVELTRIDQPTAGSDAATHHIRGVYGVRFGNELPALTEGETRDVVAILRSPSSYREDGVSGCMFSPVIALQFATRDKLAALICFQCRQIQFVRGKKNLDSPDLTGPAAQALLDAVRRVLPSLPEKLRN